MPLALRSTRVLLDDGLRPATVLVDEGRIRAVAAWGEAPAGAELRDFGDSVLMPGLVDTHVHINDPGRTEWEGFDTATQAAATGGVTTLVDMPLNCQPETINVGALQAKRAAAKGKAWVDWATWGGVVRGNAEELQMLVRASVPGFKCFMLDSGIDGFAWVEESDLRLALGHLRGTGVPLLVHAEVDRPIKAATERLNAAKADWHRYLTYLASRPGAAEVEAIALLIRLAGEFQTPIHIVHLSSAATLPLLSDARQRGLPITVETCTHYLWFAAEEIPDGATEFKCAPPIRDAHNREALWKALEAGLIDFVVTDHSPCPPEMKNSKTQSGHGRWDLAWGGIASLGLALPVLWTAMVRRGLAIEKIGNWMGSEPARLAGFRGRKGTLVPGADADFVIFVPEARWVVTSEQLHFRHKLSPYIGAELQGRVLETWLRGEPVYRAGNMVGAARGKELLRP